MQNARGILVRKQQKMTGRPVTPLHKGHVGLLACSGMLNGFFGEGEMRHIAHWRSVKYVDDFNEEEESEGGDWSLSNGSELDALMRSYGSAARAALRLIHKSNTALCSRF